MINLSIQPLFVFDGPNKPPFKRSKRTGPNVASIPEFLAKQLLKQFGFPQHVAPGEAEAECALLQHEGVVDAVLSEDVDTLMFGSRKTIRNWSSNDKNKTPTHINLYDAEETKNGPSGLDREGMILVALMSGGDYVPEGIPGCGPKVACEAARAGFGAELCKIQRTDKSALRAWRDRLSHELQTNESKYFRVKHSALKIPEDFPRSDILGYYTHPAVSSSDRVQELRRRFAWDQDFDFAALRSFAGDCFDWRNISGAKKFVRNLAPALLVRSLRLGSDKVFIKDIHQERKHASTDELPELRVSYVPMDLVDIDLDAEDPDDDIAQEVDDAEADPEGETEVVSDGTKPRGPYLYDPTKADKVWIPEVFVKHGAPALYEEWTAKLAAPKKTKKNGNAKKGGSGRSKSKAVDSGPMNEFVRATKPFRPSTPTGDGEKPFRDQELPFRASQTPQTFRHQKPPVEEPISLLSSPGAETDAYPTALVGAEFATEADSSLATVKSKPALRRTGSPTRSQNRRGTATEVSYISLLSSPAPSTPRKGTTPAKRRTPKASEKTPSKDIRSYFSPSPRNVNRTADLDPFSASHCDALDLTSSPIPQSRAPPPAFRQPTTGPDPGTPSRRAAAHRSNHAAAPPPCTTTTSSSFPAPTPSSPAQPRSTDQSWTAPSPSVPPEVAARRKRQKAGGSGAGRGGGGAHNVGGALEMTRGWFRVRKSMPGAFAIVEDEALLDGKAGWRVEDVRVVDLT
jgi:Holliday junction resolvase YEN1